MTWTKFSDPDWWPLARHLHSQGWKPDAIAAHLGRSRGGVHRAINPDKYRQKDRQYKERVGAETINARWRRNAAIRRAQLNSNE